MNIRNKY
nr:Sic1.263 [Streptococcus pyogenes]